MLRLHPAMALMVLTGVCLSSILPLLLWFRLGDRTDGNAKLWHAGLGVLATGVIAAGMRQSPSWLSGSAVLVSALLCLEAIRRESGMKPFGLTDLAIVAIPIVSAEFAIYSVGEGLTWGVLLTNFAWAGIDLTTIVLVHRLSIRRNSRGLVVVVVGAIPPLILEIFRGVQVLLTGADDNLFTYPPLTVAALFAITAGSLLKAIGYLFFSLECAQHQGRADAIELAREHERRRAAETHAEAMRQIIEQRDRMIMISSRFSTLNSLALFNSATVHEISQPLHALGSALDVLWLSASDAADELRDGLCEARLLATKIGRVVATLRHLISHHGSAEPQCDVRAVADDVAEVARGTANRNGIDLRLSIEGSDTAIVNADRALLERILFNLVTNSIEALGEGTSDTRSAPAAGSAWIGIRLRCLPAEAGGCAVISVCDNGPGFPAEIESAGPALLHTTKQNGIGVGLTLAKIVVEKWRGQFVVRNWSVGLGTGAMVELSLPLASASAEVVTNEPA